MNKKMFIILVLTMIMLCVSACGKTDNKEQSSVNNTSNISNTQSANLSGTVPDELDYIPDGYENPATQQGTLNKLTYDTWESFSYEQKSNKITKEAWVYLPYGYTDEEVDQCFGLILRMLSMELGYIRYDYDPDHENGTMHPLHHLDVNYSSQGTYKLGMNRKIQTDEFVDMLDVKTACRYIQKK